MDIKRILTIYIAVVFLSGSIAIADINDGLIAYYPFNGNTNDESGNKNNGVVHGATLTNDRFGRSKNAYSFDGVSSYIEAKSPKINQDEGALSLWVNLSSLNAFTRIIYINGFIVALGEENSGQLVFSKKLTGIESGESLLSLNKWHHIVTTYSNGNIDSIFLDGNLINTHTRDDYHVCNDEITWIGRQLKACPGGRTYAIDGSIDDIRIYDRSLSERDVLELYNLEDDSDKESCTLPKVGTVSSNLDIYMPSLSYQSLLGTQNIWADLEYKGTNSVGQHIWGLKDFGVNQ